MSEQYYDQDYFEWQKRIGTFGGLANKFKFEPFISPTDHILDFGCGGGYLLKNLECAIRSGIDINPAAREIAEQNGVTVYASIDDVPSDYADVVICHNVLEHLECPLHDVRAVLPKVKPGGRAVFVILNQMPWEKYVANDINRHLYTWNPMTLGTLLEVAGFVNVQVDVIRHMWPPNYLEVYERWGQRIFDLICRMRARRKQNYQIRAVAERA